MIDILNLGSSVINLGSVVLLPGTKTSISKEVYLSHRRTVDYKIKVEKSLKVITGSNKVKIS